MGPPGNGWNRYEELVLHELRELRSDHALVAQEITEIRLEVERLKVKSGIWGAVSGLLVSAGTALLTFIKLMS